MYGINEVDKLIYGITGTIYIRDDKFLNKSVLKIYKQI